MLPWGFCGADGVRASRPEGTPKQSAAGAVGDRVSGAHVQVAPGLGLDVLAPAIHMPRFVGGVSRDPSGHLVAAAAGWASTGAIALASIAGSARALPNRSRKSLHLLSSSSYSFWSSRYPEKYQEQGVRSSTSTVTSGLGRYMQGSLAHHSSQMALIGASLW